MTTLTLNYFKIRAESVMTAIEKFLSKINIIESGCWEWAVGLTSGYGEFWFNNKSALSHRFIYEYYYGSICPDLTIDHLCRKRKCCNVLHLEQVTQKENILRGIGITAINARKTHCIQGYPLSGDNLRVKKDGERRCKTCHREREKESRKLKKIDSLVIFKS